MAEEASQTIQAVNEVHSLSSKRPYTVEITKQWFLPAESKIGKH